MDGLGETLYVGGCDSGYGYSTVFGGVDRMLDRIRQCDGCTEVGSMACTSLANLSICSGFRPVYANIPI